MQEISFEIRDGFIQFRSPFDRELVEAIKELPREQRKWEDGMWKIEGKLIENVRHIAADAGTRRNWIVLDKTIQTRKESEKTSRDEHLRRSLEALNQVPPHGMKLIAWRNDTLSVQAEYFLGKEVFEALRDSALKSYRPTLSWGAVKGDEKWIFEFTARPDVLRVLAEKRTCWLNVHKDLTLVADFGRFRHYADKEHNLFIGVAPERTDTNDWQWTAAGAWPVVFEEDKTFIVRKAYDLFREYLKSDPVMVGRNVVGHPARPVVGMLDHFHLTDWTKEVVIDALRKPCGLRDQFNNGWRKSDWHHPTDDYLAYFCLPDARGENLRNVVGWNPDQARAERERIEGLRIEAAAQSVACARANAREWALPVLENETKQDLQGLAQMFGLSFKKSASKPERLRLCAEHQGLCEYVLKIPKAKGGTI